MPDCHPMIVRGCQKNGNHSKHNAGCVLASNRLDSYKDMNQWKPADWIVMFLTIVIGAMLLLASMHSIIHGTELSEKKTEMLIGLIGSLVAIISIYIGSKIQNRDK